MHGAGILLIEFGVDFCSNKQGVKMVERQDGASQMLVLRSFFRGATQPNFASAAIMLGVLLIVILAYIAVVNDKLLAGNSYRYFMDDNLDTQTYATHQILGVESGDEPSVLIFGSSVMVRCIKDRDTVADLVSTKSDQSVIAYNLSTDAQTMWEFEAMVDRIPDGGRGVLVFGVSFGMWTFSLEDLEELIDAPKLGLPTPTIDAAAREAGIDVPFRTGVYGLDASSFFLARRRTFLKNLLSGGMSYGDPLTAWWMKNVNDPEFWEEEKARLPEQVAEVEENLNRHLATVARAIEDLRSKGDYEVILFEAPINPDWFELDTGRRFFTGLRQDLMSFAEAENIRFASALDLVDLTADDFVDFEGHISNDEARMACTEAVSDLVVEALTR